MTTSMTRRVTLPTRPTVAWLKTWLERVPENAMISVSHEPGDRPFDASSSSITATWEEPDV